VALQPPHDRGGRRTLVNKPPLDQCLALFGAIFDDDDVIEFRPLPPKHGHEWRTPTTFSEVLDWLTQANAAGAHCYFGANPRNRVGGTKEEHVDLARCLFVDFDGGVAHEVAWSRIEEQGLPRPTATVTSGGGTHCWWRLDEPLRDRVAWSARQKALAEALDADVSGTSGWPRIMRLPGFVNHKYEHKPAAELVEVDAGRVYSFDAVRPRQSMSEASRAFVDRGETLAGLGRRDTMFRVACDLRDHGWTAADATAMLMPRMAGLALDDEELADCPRQIANAWKREPRDRPAATSTSSPATSTSSPVEVYQPFPVDALPDVLATFVAETADAIGCDPAYVALPLLTVAGAAVGTTRRLELKAGYSVPAILWSAIVGESGTSKSPALRSVLEHVRGRERRLREEYALDRRDHEAAVEAYEKERSAWRASKAAGDPPERPAEPVGRRCLVSDVTVEALALKLADNPRGLLLARDELAGWLGSLDRYASKSGGGSDESFYLSSYNGESHAVDRRTGDRREVYVAQAALWITGTIQPAILRRALGTERRESGLLARLLLTAPPARPATWSEREVCPLTRQYLHDTLGRLYELEPDVDADGREEPRLVRLTPEAKAAYVEWHDQHGEELAELTGDRAAAWSKLRETAARLALVIHAVRVSAGDVDDEDVDKASMDCALRLAEWHKGETRRVYAILGQSDEEAARRQSDDRLAAWIGRHGGTVRPRDLVSRCRWLRTSDEAEAALRRLVAAGRGRWHDRPAGERGGRPSRDFVLVEPAVEAAPPKTASAEPRRAAAKRGFGCADTAAVAQKPAAEAEEEAAIEL
jgi:hypothetical protein